MATVGNVEDEVKCFQSSSLPSALLKIDETNVEITEIIRNAAKKFPNVKSLRKEQEIAINAIAFQQRDTVALLPTGYGKSLVYQLLPEIHKSLKDERRTVIVVSPLTAIMRQQVKELLQNGVRAAMLEEDSASSVESDHDQMDDDGNALVTVAEILNGNVDIVFASAEKWLSPRWKRELKSGIFGKCVSEIAVDEVHTVIEWGIKFGSAKGEKRKGKKDKEKPFREAFGKVADLKALLPGRPLVALTASLRVVHRKLLQNVLQLDNPFVIDVSPNKSNVRMSSVFAKSKEDALTKLDWLVKMIKDKGIQSPKSIIFCNVITDIAHVLSYLLMKLGSNGYILKDDAKQWLIGIYHAKSWESSKEYISEEFQTLGGGSTRVIIATSALGMGVNFTDVTYIIHFGAPCRTLEGHIQQLGRGGRNGEVAHDIVIYTARGLCDCELEVRKIYKEGGGCLRMNLFKHFDENASSLEIKHMCCSKCAKDCQCTPLSKHKCSFTAPVFEKVHEETVQYLTKRKITDVDQKEIRDALEDERQRLTLVEGGSSLSGVDSLHGFSQNLIDSVIENLHLIGSSSDVISLLPIFNIHHARIILELVQEFFNDIDNFEDEIELLCDTEKSTEEVYALGHLLDTFASPTKPLENTEHDSGSDSSDAEFDFDEALIQELGLSL